MAELRCPGCGLVHERLGLPAPRGLAATGECRAESGTVLAAFYTDPDLFDRRQYVVDAYACTHPDPTTRVGVQTTALGLMTMDLYLECGQPVADGSAMHQEMMRDHPQVFRPLDPPRAKGSPLIGCSSTRHRTSTRSWRGTGRTRCGRPGHRITHRSAPGTSCWSRGGSRAAETSGPARRPPGS